MRLLCNVLEAFKNKLLPDISLNLVVQEDLAQVLLNNFTMIKNYLDEEHEYQEKLSVTSALVFLLRLVQFFLGFPSVLKQLDRNLSKNILNILFKLSMVSNNIQHGLYMFLQPP